MRDNLHPRQPTHPYYRSSSGQALRPSRGTDGAPPGRAEQVHIRRVLGHGRGARRQLDARVKDIPLADA